MRTEGRSIELHQDILAARVAKMIAKRESLAPTEAIRRFMTTETYSLLLDAESYLHMESAEYILYMYDIEQRGDWNRWLEI